MQMIPVGLSLVFLWNCCIRLSEGLESLSHAGWNGRSIWDSTSWPLAILWSLTLNLREYLTGCHSVGVSGNRFATHRRGVNVRGINWP
jgi:hypothetical protein